MCANLSCSLQDGNELRGHPPVFSRYQGYSSTWTSWSQICHHKKLTQKNGGYSDLANTETHLPCSASAAHTMYIFLYVSWEVKVEDMSDVMDIQPSRCQVSGNQDTNSTWKKYNTVIYNLILLACVVVCRIAVRSTSRTLKFNSLMSTEKSIYYKHTHTHTPLKPV